MREIMQLPDLVERIRALGKGYAMFALQHPSHYRLMFMTPRVPCNLDITTIQHGNTEQDAYAQLKLVVKDAFEAGLFKQELTDFEVIAQTLWAGIHGVCSLEISLGHEEWIHWADVQSRLDLMQTHCCKVCCGILQLLNDGQKTNENHTAIVAID